MNADILSVVVKFCDGLTLLLLARSCKCVRRVVMRNKTYINMTKVTRVRDLTCIDTQFALKYVIQLMGIHTKSRYLTKPREYICNKYISLLERPESKKIEEAILGVNIEYLEAVKTDTLSDIIIYQVIKKYKITDLTPYKGLWFYNNIVIQTDNISGFIEISQSINIFHITSEIYNYYDNPQITKYLYRLAVVTKDPKILFKVLDNIYRYGKYKSLQAIYEENLLKDCNIRELLDNKDSVHIYNYKEYYTWYRESKRECGVNIILSFIKYAKICINHTDKFIIKYFELADHKENYSPRQKLINNIVFDTENATALDALYSRGYMKVISKSTILKCFKFQKIKTIEWLCAHGFIKPELRKSIKLHPENFVFNLFVKKIISNIHT